MPLHKSVIFLFLLPGTTNESSVIKCHIVLITWYSRGRQALVGYIGKNMPGKIFGCDIFFTHHRKGKDCHGIQNEVIGIIYCHCHMWYSCSFHKMMAS
jgi:hypothetical protein